MSLQAWWWLAAGVLAVAEIFTGSFYLLVFAVAAAAAALVALLGLSWPIQLLAAALVSTLGWFWVQRRRKQMPLTGEQSLDVGELVQVSQWHLGVGQATYRGAVWQVELAPRALSEQGAPEQVAGNFRIQAIRGNRLVVVST